MPLLAIAGIVGAGTKIAGAIGAAKADKQTLALQKQQLADQEKYTQQSLDMAAQAQRMGMATQIDARGNVLVYDKDKNTWTTILSNPQDDLADAADQEQFNQLTSDAAWNRQARDTDYAFNQKARDADFNYTNTARNADFAFNNTARNADYDFITKQRAVDAAYTEQQRQEQEAQYQTQTKEQAREDVQRGKDLSGFNYDELQNRNTRNEQNGIAGGLLAQIRAAQAGHLPYNPAAIASELRLSRVGAASAAADEAAKNYSISAVRSGATATDGALQSLAKARASQIAQTMGSPGIEAASDAATLNGQYTNGLYSQYGAMAGAGSTPGRTAAQSVTVGVPNTSGSTGQYATIANGGSPGSGGSSGGGGSSNTYQPISVNGSGALASTLSANNANSNGIQAYEAGASTAQNAVSNVKNYIQPNYNLGNQVGNLGTVASSALSSLGSKSAGSLGSNISTLMSLFGG